MPAPLATSLHAEEIDVWRLSHLVSRSEKDEGTVYRFAVLAVWRPTSKDGAGFILRGFREPKVHVSRSRAFAPRRNATRRAAKKRKLRKVPPAKLTERRPSVE